MDGEALVSPRPLPPPDGLAGEAAMNLTDAQLSRLAQALRRPQTPFKLRQLARDFRRPSRPDPRDRFRAPEEFELEILACDIGLKTGRRANYGRPRAEYGKREIWAGAIEMLILQNDNLDLSTTRSLAVLANAIRKDQHVFIIPKEPIR
jgi:hypothetical protein